jgi:hypothetical protein
MPPLPSHPSYAARVGRALRILGKAALAGKAVAAEPAPVDFDAARIWLTGNVTSPASDRDTSKHQGWLASAMRLPAVVESLHPRVLALAEVEL